MKNLFYNWMATQTHRRDSVGEFARVIVEDPTFPRLVKIIPSMRKYVRDRWGKDTPYLPMLMDAYNEYNRSGQANFCYELICRKRDELLVRCEAKEARMRQKWFQHQKYIS